MKTIKTTWTGIRPLIMSNPQTVQLSNPHAVEARRLNTLIKAARKKGDENKLAELEEKQAKNDWEASAYWNDDARKFFIPDSVIIACIRAGAVAAKKGKDIDRAVIICEPQAYVETDSVKSLDDLWTKQKERFSLSGPARVPPKTGALIWKCRCMMPTGWKISFSMDFDEEIVAEKSLIEALEIAGRLIGIGGWRPKFGRFITKMI